MTYAGIEAFLAVCRHKSISKAAAELFLSQSSLSIRLKTLETELGCTLFLRQKGCHEILLTEEGQRFYQLSLQYQEIVQNMLSVGKKENMLRISAINSIATYLLPPVYEQFIKQYPDVRLEFQDMTSEVACKKILQRKTDLAFTTDCPTIDSIKADIILEEKMVLICSPSSYYAKQIKQEMLPRDREIYIEWSNEFVQWHSNIWSTTSFPKIQVEIMSQIQTFIIKNDCWAIVPISVAEGLSPIGIKPLEPMFEIPTRKIYALKSVTSTTPVFQAFENIAYRLWNQL